MYSSDMETMGGSISYEIIENEAHIRQCKVKDSIFEIPKEIEGCPVTIIEKKAFLSCKRLSKVELPDTIREIGEWAFAHCDALSVVCMHRSPVSFGKGVFKDCRKLEKIFVSEDEKVAGLLAMAPVQLDAEYLLDLVEAGTKEWTLKLDARLKALLELPDEEGYLKQVLCGEEDLMSTIEVFLEEKHLQKVGLCYSRLMNDFSLPETMEGELQNYLKENTVGCEYEAAWEFILKEHGMDKRYYEIFANAGCIEEDNFERLLHSMGENYPEMKAWLLNYKETEMNHSNFFDAFVL